MLNNKAFWQSQDGDGAGKGGEAGGIGEKGYVVKGEVYEMGEGNAGDEWSIFLLWQLILKEGAKNAILNT